MTDRSDRICRESLAIFGGRNGPNEALRRPMIDIFNVEVSRGALARSAGVHVSAA